MATNSFTTQVNYGRNHPDFHKSHCRLRKFCGPLLYRLPSKWDKNLFTPLGQYCFHCTDFQRAQNYSTALRWDLQD